jgi:hypothetical protein
MKSANSIRDANTSSSQGASFLSQIMWSQSHTARASVLEKQPKMSDTASAAKRGLRQRLAAR